MNRFLILLALALSLLVTACGSRGGGGFSSTARYTIKVEDVGATAPTTTNMRTAAVSTSSIAVGCEGYTYTHVPTEAWGLDDHYNTRFIRATVFDRGEVLQGAKVSWVIDSGLVRQVEERDNLLAIVPQSPGIARLTAAYEDSVATQTVYIYDAATFGSKEDEVVGFDLDGDGTPDIEVTIGRFSSSQQMRFPSGASVASNPVDRGQLCSHHDDEVLRFYQLTNVPVVATYDMDWQRAATGTYVVRASGGDHYKVLVGSVGIRSSTMNEITLGIQYVAADSMGQFPY